MTIFPVGKLINILFELHKTVFIAKMTKGQQTLFINKF